MRVDYNAHPYQDLITQHILDHRRCNVFARMGMGKTVAALTAVDIENLVDGTQPTLVLAPKRVARGVWPREAEKWKHLTNIHCVPVLGTPAERRQALRADANVWATNYDNLPWLINEYSNRRWPFTRVIADESTRLKNFRLRQGGKRSTALATVAHGYTSRWTNLTGTPAPNGLKDTWGQQWFVDGGVRLGRSFTAFKERWFQRAWDGYGVDPLEFAQVQIQDAIRDVTIALDPKDWFDIEEPIVRNIYVDLPSKARSHYRDMEKEMFTLLLQDKEERGVEAFNAAVRTIKCLQIASGAIYYEKNNSKKWIELHEEKLDALESILTEANGMPLLIATQWRFEADMIRRRFPKMVVLEGDDTELEDAFNAGKIPGLLAHPKSAGHGLNLQYGSNIVTFFGHWWDLELYQQIIERIGPVRQLQAGLDRNVWVYHILARDTVDEDVMVRRESKRRVQDILMDSMKRRAA